MALFASLALMMHRALFPCKIRKCTALCPANTPDQDAAFILYSLDRSLVVPVPAHLPILGWRWRDGTGRSQGFFLGSRLLVSWIPLAPSLDLAMESNKGNFCFFVHVVGMSALWPAHEVAFCCLLYSCALCACSDVVDISLMSGWFTSAMTSLRARAPAKLAVDSRLLRVLPCDDMHAARQTLAEEADVKLFLIPVRSP